MGHHVIKIRELLLELGWQIAPVETVYLEWWADEMWALESALTPMGKPVWLTFLVDPMISNSAERQKGEAVWAIMLTQHKPWNWQDDHTGLTLPLGRKQERAIQRLEAWLKGYRNQ